MLSSTIPKIRDASVWTNHNFKLFMEFRQGKSSGVILNDSYELENPLIIAFSLFLYTNLVI